MTEFLRAVAALAFTLGLVGLGAWLVRRFGMDWLQRFAGVATRKARRLIIEETLVLGPAHRLALVKLDGRERLILMGDGRELAPAPPPTSDAGPEQ